jgi:hypothetical protein
MIVHLQLVNDLAMEMLTSPKTEYLLQSSLEVLHEQSLEYLNEIDFMKVEISFFNKLLNKNAGKQFPGEQSAALGKRMIKFVSSTIPDLRKKIMEHERWLSDIIKTDTLGRQESYREVHRALTKEMTMCRENFVRLKKKVFSFAKK